jgi:DNA-directed RNA polymerase subunit F
MAIIESTPLTLSEVLDLAGDTDREKEIKTFIKKFTKMPIDKAKAMREELEKLELLKLKEEYIVKIVDFLPKDAIDLNKIIVDVSLDQEEVNKILDVVKKY